MSTPVIILDNGTSTIKGGLSTESDPTVVVPTVVARSRFGIDITQDDAHVAYDLAERINKKNILSYPIENGVVTNWEYMEKVWSYVIKRLNVQPEEYPMLLTEAPNNPRANREKMTEVMFEKFSAPSLLYMSPGILSLYGAGQLSGIVLEIGHSITQVVPAIEGYTIKNSILRSDFAGSDLTDFFMKQLSDNNQEVKLTTKADKEIIQTVKEKFCYVCEDYDKEMKLETNRFPYTLPDGRNIEIGNEKFVCPEILFDPSLMANIDGIHKIINKSIQLCPVDVKKALYSNIILSGGTAMLPGLDKRLESFMKSITFDGMKIKVREPKNKYMAWCGGSVLANHPTFHSMSVTRQQFAEHGANILFKSE